MLCICLAYTTATATRCLSASCFSPVLRTVSARRRSSVNIYEKKNNIKNPVRLVLSLLLVEEVGHREVDHTDSR